eukprot:1158574-Pelagomonas_calceolata.AAC.4
MALHFWIQGPPSTERCKHDASKNARMKTSKNLRAEFLEVLCTHAWSASKNARMMPQRMHA